MPPPHHAAGLYGNALEDVDTLRQLLLRCQQLKARRLGRRGRDMLAPALLYSATWVDLRSLCRPHHRS